MTIAEIESTLRTLFARHPNLDAELLVTLLTAGGWENKVIKDAVALFTSAPNKYRESMVLTQSPAQSEQVIVPHTVPIDTAPILITENSATISEPQVTVPPVSADIVYYKSGGEEETELPVISNLDAYVEKHEKSVEPPITQEITEPITVEVLPIISVEEKTEEIKNQNPEISKVALVTEKAIVAQNIPPTEIHTLPVDEPQSLITPPPVKISEKIDPPPNLPLKPFESTPHVWPFSKYKEVFHGETMPVLSVDERALVNETIPPVIVKPAKKIKIKRTGFDNEDEGLIFLTATTLLVILLLLAYMYSNGRI